MTICCAYARPGPCPYHDEAPDLFPDHDDQVDPAPTWPAAELKVSALQFSALVMLVAGAQCSVLLDQPWWLGGGSALAGVLLLAGRWTGARRG